MCIQSYYNYNEKQNQEEEIELDLLKEIKDVGIDDWNEQISEQREDETKTSSKKEN